MSRVCQCLPEQAPSRTSPLSNTFCIYTFSLEKKSKIASYLLVLRIRFFFFWKPHPLKAKTWRTTPVTRRSNDLHYLHYSRSTFDNPNLMEATRFFSDACKWMSLSPGKLIGVGLELGFILSFPTVALMSFLQDCQRKWRYKREQWSDRSLAVKYARKSVAGENDRDDSSETKSWILRQIGDIPTSH
jgi:hypothetical protein